MENIEEIFYYVDEFCKAFDKWFMSQQIGHKGKRKRTRYPRMYLSEIVTVILMFHASGHRCFKDYYFYLLRYHSKDFNKIVCYDRFVALLKMALPVLVAMLRALSGEKTEVMFMDSTPYVVCKMCRSSRHKVFGGLAGTSKNSVGWWFGMKLHFVFNMYGEILKLKVTKGNMDDRAGAKDLLKGLIGKVFADRGYLGKNFFRQMFDQGLEIITKIKAKMKNVLMSGLDKLLLGKRKVVESIFSSIKSCNTFEHSRHRNVENAFCHILSALIMYQLRPNKPSFISASLPLSA